VYTVEDFVEKIVPIKMAVKDFLVVSLQVFLTVAFVGPFLLVETHGRYLSLSAALNSILYSHALSLMYFVNTSARITFETIESLRTLSQAVVLTIDPEVELQNSKEISDIFVVDANDFQVINLSEVGVGDKIGIPIIIFRIV